MPAGRGVKDQPAAGEQHDDADPGESGNPRSRRPVSPRTALAWHDEGLSRTGSMNRYLSAQVAAAPMSREPWHEWPGPRRCRGPRRSHGPRRRSRAAPMSRWPRLALGPATSLVELPLLGSPFVDRRLLPVVTTPVARLRDGERVHLGAMAGNPSANCAGLHADARGCVVGADPQADRAARARALAWIGGGPEQVDQDSGVRSGEVDPDCDGRTGQRIGPLRGESTDPALPPPSGGARVLAERRTQLVGGSGR